MHQIELSCWDRFLMVSCTQSDNGPWDNGPYRTVEPLPIEDGMQDLAGQIAIAMKAGLLGVLEWPEVCVSPCISCVLCVTCANAGGAWASTHRTQIPTTDQCEAKKALAPVPRCLVSPQKIYKNMFLHFISLLEIISITTVVGSSVGVCYEPHALGQPGWTQWTESKWQEMTRVWCKDVQSYAIYVQWSDWSGWIFAAHFWLLGARAWLPNAVLEDLEGEKLQVLLQSWAGLVSMDWLVLGL